MNDKPSNPDKYHWKRSYTIVLLANVGYIIVFYVLMLLFS